jgi:hypothetical protein
MAALNSTVLDGAKCHLEVVAVAAPPREVLLDGRPAFVVEVLLLGLARAAAPTVERLNAQNRPGTSAVRRDVDDVEGGALPRAKPDAHHEVVEQQRLRRCFRRRQEPLLVPRGQHRPRPTLSTHRPPALADIGHGSLRASRTWTVANESDLRRER